MRLISIVVVTVLAAEPADAGALDGVQDRSFVSMLRVDVGQTETPVATETRYDDTDGLLREHPSPPEAVERSLLPAVNFGPLHATIGGINQGRASLGTYEIDTRDFWNSQISGSLDSRGARINFTLPIR
jgi:hypothetical protein